MAEELRRMSEMADWPQKSVPSGIFRTHWRRSGSPFRPCLKLIFLRCGAHLASVHDIAIDLDKRFGANSRLLCDLVPVPD